MAEEDRSPLLRLLAPRTLSRKKRKPAFPPPPHRKPAEHGRALDAGLHEVQRHFEEAARRLPSLVTDVPYVRIEVAPGALINDAELLSLGLIPVYRREDSILAAYSRERDLRTFNRQLTSYSQLKKTLGVFAKIETVKPWSRADRASSRLRDLTIDADAEYTVDLLLMPLDWEHENPQAPGVIERFVTERHGTIVDRALEPTFSALRVRVRGQALDELLDYRDDVALVDLPPKAEVLVPEVLSLKLDDLPEIGEPPSGAPAICVVDSGILEGHPLLSAAVIGSESMSFPPQLGSPIPRAPVTAAGHGTQVAGLALYGDVAASAHAKSFQPGLRIINARMLDDANELHPDRMPFLRQVVEHVKERCRVLNLSFGLDPHEGYLSIHAAELDALTREFGVLFVVSAGNVNPRVHFKGKLPKKPFPDFLLDSAWKVRAPAEALNVLTVGGITPDSDPYPHAHRAAVAPKRAPSPFACSGGVKNVVKPELVEVAGNLAFDHGTNLWIENDIGLRVVTTNPGFASGALLGFVHGTSFSAPKVAHMAARIVERYPEASTNLLRALLVQSARPPAGVSDWDKAQILRLCGFGVPDLDRALYCRPLRATLYFEGEIAPDDVKLFEVPVPSGFAKAKGRKTLSVTIAYDAPVSVVHRDRPAGIQLTWGLARGDVSEATVQAAIAAEAEAENAGVTTKAVAGAATKRKPVFMPGSLPKRMQQRGTVQKNVFTWARGDYGETYRLAITAKASRPAHAEHRQAFALVVSLECEDESVNVFNVVRARIAAGRVRVRVRAE